MRNDRCCSTPEDAMKSQPVRHIVGILSIAVLQNFTMPAWGADIQLAASNSAQDLRPQAKIAPKFTADQLAEMQARAQLATTIANNVEADAVGKGASATWRIDLMSALYSTPSASLRAIAANARTLDQAHAANSVANTASPKSLGSPTDSLVFTPTTPCRFVDTRTVGGPITTPRDFDTFQSGPTYGGASGCTLPGTGEPAFAANVTIIVPAGIAGFLGIRPFGNTAVTSFINWPAEGATDGLANAGIVATGINSANSHYEFEVFRGGGNSPQFVLDYFGYFSAASQAATALDCVEQPQVQSTINAGQSTFIYTPACSTGYTQIESYCYTADAATYLTGSGPGFCAWHNTGGSASTVSEEERCCRVPAN
jgi:hypothetical protein